MFVLPHIFPRLPYPGPLSDSKLSKIPPCSWFLEAYSLWYTGAHDRLIAWHKRKLLQIDSDYEREDAMQQLMQARSEARERGMKSNDPQHPVLSDFLK